MDSKKLHFHVTEERLADVPLGDLMAVEEKPTITAMVNLLANFVQNGTGYLPKEQALAYMRQLKVGQLKAVTDQVMGKIKDTVPNM